MDDRGEDAGGAGDVPAHVGQFQSGAADGFCSRLRPCRSRLTCHVRGSFAQSVREALVLKQVNAFPVLATVSSVQGQRQGFGGEGSTYQLSAAVSFLNIAADRFDINAYRRCSQRKPQAGDGAIGVFGMETKLFA